nr:hypothetical protein [Tanacetum cinerariifolium]
RSHTAKTFDLVWMWLGGDYGKLFLMGYTGIQWIETTNEGTKILAAVDGKPKTIFKSSIRRNLIVNDEEGISTLPDAELFENLALMGYNILPNQKFTFQKNIPTLRQYSRRATRIAQSKALPTTVDEPVSFVRDIVKERLFLLSLAKKQDRIGKTSLRPLPCSMTQHQSGLVPTVSAIFTTASVVTPYSRRKEIEEQMAREGQRMHEQIARDAEIARIHAEEELQMLIDGLDRNNEVIAKHLHEYEQSAADLTIGEKIKLINELSSEATLDGKPNISKRKGLKLEQGSAKRMKTSEDVSEEDLKEMMQLVPVEEVYVEALQVKHPIIDLEIHTEGKRDYWKIISDEDLMPEYFPTASEELFPLLNEPASPMRDVSKREACPTKSGFIADQDRTTIAKSSTLPYDSALRVTSPAADEGSMQHNIFDLTALCTSLQRQYSKLLAKFQAQEEEIIRLKERV